MLLGIALLIVASFGVSFWMAGAAVGAVIFIVFLILGLFFCIDGYLTPNDK
jgi:hypothetical protein